MGALQAWRTWAKVIYNYNGMKVIFKDGKVTDVQVTQQDRRGGIDDSLRART